MDPDASKPNADHPEAEPPLLLTPYINAGQIETAQKLCRVDAELPGPSAAAPAPRDSYSGFITVDPELCSHLFFWFFPAANQPRTAPVILWIEGGPGFSALWSLFNHNGPYVYKASGGGGGKIEPRAADSDWTRDYSIIYVDNPVGTGFSFSNAASPAGIPKTSEENAVHLLEFLRQFRLLFPEYATEATPLYLVGESYGGHFGPPLGALILKEAPEIAANLKGMLFLVPWTNPSLQVSFYADYLYQLGLIDPKTSVAVKKEQTRIQELVQVGKLSDAKDAWFGLVSVPGAFAKATGFTYAFHALQGSSDPFFAATEFTAYIQTPEFRRVVHAGVAGAGVGAVPYPPPFSVLSWGVIEAMAGDIMASKADHLAAILDSRGSSVTVTIVSAQLDTRIIHLGVEAMVNALDWSGKEEFAGSGGQRRVWTAPTSGIDAGVPVPAAAGYARTAKNLNYILVQNGGHNLIADAPQKALQLVNEFIPRNDQ